jgi:two-component system LytT family response regulator
MEIKAIIIDDEINGIQMLKALIQQYTPMVHIHGYATNHADAYKLIDYVRPDLLFLDIEMPEGTGFDLVNKLDKFTGHIIFTTAYSQYAVKAFKYNAVDYLLKPIDHEDLQHAIDKVADKMREKSGSKNLVTISNQTANKIGIPTAEGISFIDINEIIKCVARENYTEVFLNNGKSVMVSRTLKDFEETLEPFQFIRVHNSYLVNIMYIQKYVKAGYVVLTDDSIVEVSKRRKTSVLERFASLGK